MAFQPDEIWEHNQLEAEASQEPVINRRLENVSEMTGSYSEICEEDEDWGESAGLARLDGMLIEHGELISWVAGDLEAKLRSPSGGESPAHVQLGLLAELESQARSVASSIDSLVEHLSATLHAVSALSADCVETYRDAVCKTCDRIDANIKSMYQLMAKCEELSNSIKPLQKLAAHIKNIKHLLDLLEAVGI